MYHVDFALTAESKGATCCDLVAQYDEFSRLVVMQTLSKAWGLAGIRLGMVFCHPSVAQIINNVKVPYNESVHLLDELVCIVSRSGSSTHL